MEENKCQACAGVEGAAHTCGMENSQPPAEDNAGVEKGSEEAASGGEGKSQM